MNRKLTKWRTGRPPRAGVWEWKWDTPTPPFPPPPGVGVGVDGPYAYWDGLTRFAMADSPDEALMFFKRGHVGTRAFTHWRGLAEDPNCKSPMGDVVLCPDAACGWMGRCEAAAPTKPAPAVVCEHGQSARVCDRCDDTRPGEWWPRHRFERPDYP